MKKHWLLIALPSLLSCGEVSREETAMHIHTLRFVRAGALLAALAVSLGMFVSSTDHVKAQADAPIDISGDWIIRVSNGLTCTATITQAGTGPVHGGGLWRELYRGPGAGRSIPPPETSR